LASASEDPTVFERRYEDWISSHPRYVVFADYQIERIVKAQFEAADRIIVSQDRITDEVRRITDEVRRITDEVSGVSSLAGEVLYTLDWGSLNYLGNLKCRQKHSRGS
jgi:hypothetical protein